MNSLSQSYKKNQQMKASLESSESHREEAKAFVIGLSDNEEQSLQTITKNSYCW